MQLIEKLEIFSALKAFKLTIESEFLSEKQIDEAILDW